MGLLEIQKLKAEALTRIRTHRIKPKSDKRKVEEKEYLKIRSEILEKRGKCEWPGCNKKAIDVHHSCGRVGKNYADKKKMKALCREHHNLAEWNPTLAKTLKISESRLKK